MKTSRQRLLEYLASQRATTAEELSRALKMTQANARHHLGILEQQGLVESAGSQTHPGRGRPAVLYRLSSAALKQNLEPLAAALLEELLDGRAEAEQAQLLGQVARRLAERGSPAAVKPGEGPKSLTQRLFVAVGRLNALQYQARWEARPDGPRLTLGRCPYAGLLPEHPELCRLDTALLEGMLGSPVHQTARLEPDTRGVPHCAFRVGVRRET